MNPTIDQLWQSLQAAGTALHRRVDESHPLELYAEFDQPDRPGLVLFCAACPPEARVLRAVAIDRGQRQDGRWWLRIALAQPALLPVFSALCRDIVAFTRTGIEESAAPSAILGRLDRWRRLLEGEHGGMTEASLRGLIGELVIFERNILPAFPPYAAVVAWTGPLGAAQDFLRPDGHRIEVKAVRPDAIAVRINGLAQLDGGLDPLTLAVVRLETCGVFADGVITAPLMIERLQERLECDPAARNEFDSRLAAAGWHAHPAHADLVVRVAAIELFAVGEAFPRLVRATVPHGIDDADYTVILPTENTRSRLDD